MSFSYNYQSIDSMNIIWATQWKTGDTVCHSLVISNDFPLRSIKKRKKGLRFIKSTQIMKDQTIFFFHMENFAPLIQ